MANELNVLTKGDLMEALQRVIEPRLAWERSQVEQISILQTKELVHRGEIAKIQDSLEALPHMELQLKRILEVIDGSSRHSDIGALRRIDALEKNKDGRTFIIALCSSVITALTTLLLVFFGKR